MEKKRRRYLSVLCILGVFLILAIALLGQHGWMLRLSVNSELDILSDSEFYKVDMNEVTNGNVFSDATCLYLWDSRDKNSVVFHEEMPQIFRDMDVEFTEIDLKNEKNLKMDSYEIVTLGFTNYQDNREIILSAVEWMENGGHLFIPQVPEGGSAYTWMSSRIGVKNMGNTYYSVEGIRILDEFMLTGNTSDYEIAYPFESALPVELIEECNVYITTADKSGIPVLWETKAKKGQAVVVNLGHYDKSTRGIYAMAYSLLKDYCIWPVINSSAFYLDGFPFPLSEEKNAYITDVYGENTSMYSFYVQRWWNDLMSLAREYGIRYTATLLENNDNDVFPPYETQGAANRYQYFISTLVEMGGEEGLYGYNQQPLVLKNSLLTETEEVLPDYEKELKLNYWNSISDMVLSLKETEKFQKSISEKVVMQVYTPPSNIWTEDGLNAVKEALPSIKAVAGLYFNSGYACEQEYMVDADGMIMTPRITSGSYIDSYMKMCTLSELNMHYIVSHAISPTDVINPDAGAEFGWPTMLESLEEYVQWVKNAAPGLRQQIGSETAAAVQRFWYINIEEKEIENGVEFTLDNFKDEAWFMIRLNKWEPDMDNIEGGELVNLTSNLYLLKAEAESIRITRKDIK